MANSYRYTNLLRPYERFQSIIETCIQGLFAWAAVKWHKKIQENRICAAYNVINGH